MIYDQLICSNVENYKCLQIEINNKNNFVCNSLTITITGMFIFFILELRNDTINVFQLYYWHLHIKLAVSYRYIGLDVWDFA